MKNYNITVLGAQGSGKTVLLACMHDFLSIQSEELGFSLQVPDKNTRQKLNLYFATIANPMEDWLPGDRALTEWKFDCQVQIKLKKYTCCSFTYIDYAGGQITINASPELESRIKNSDALIGLLDGKKVLAMMKGEQDVTGIWINKSRAEFSLDIRNILQDMGSIENKDDSDPPSIHFVITKWDLLKGFTLEQVRNKLMEIQQFKDFVKLRRDAGQVVRLIPVSAVGFKFAKLQADGTIKKILNSSPEPYQMEMPLACIFVAKLRKRYQKNVQKETERIETNEIELQKREQQGIDYTGKEIFSQFAVDVLGDWVKGVPLFGKIISEQSNARQRKEEEYKQAIEYLEREIKASYTRVTDEKTALEFVEKKLLSLQTELDRRYPASLL